MVLARRAGAGIAGALSRRRNTASAAKCSIPSIAREDGSGPKPPRESPGPPQVPNVSGEILLPGDRQALFHQPPLSAPQKIPSNRPVEIPTGWYLAHHCGFSGGACLTPSSEILSGLLETLDATGPPA